jgi:hypothetical protein
MDEFLILVLFAAVVALLVKQSGLGQRIRKLEDLRDELGSFDRRLTRLEENARSARPQEPQVATAAPVTPQPIVSPPHGPFSAPIATTAQKPVVPAVSSFTMPPAPMQAPVARTQVFREEPAAAPKPEAPVVSRSLSIEERLGQNWLNKLGIVTLVIGLALFLGYQLRTLGPLGKSLTGLALSVALLGGGLVLERRANYRIFARAAIGGGWALTFFVVFALYHVQAMKVLQSQAVDLVLMLAIAGAMVWHSLRYKSQVVTSLAFLLAFVTVGISDVTLFSLVAGAMLAAALVLVAAREYWFELGLAGLVGVYFNHFLWLHRVLPEGVRPGQAFPEFLPSAGLLLLYWLIFRLFYVLCVPKNQRQEVVSSLTAILNSVGLMSLLKFQSSHPEWAFWSLVALGAAELVFAFVARRRWKTAFVVLSSIGSVLLLAAIPFRFSGANWSLLWLLQAEVLLLAGLRLREVVFRRLGMLAGFAVAAQLFITGVVPVVVLRQQQQDPSRHVGLAVTLLSAAVLFWLNSEFAPRRWAFLNDTDLDRAALLLTSYLAPIVAAFGLWVCLPGAWTVVAWMVLVLLLAWMAGRIRSTDLAMQTDLLALAVIVRTGGLNFFVADHLGVLTLRAVTVTLVAAMLYVGMRRGAASYILQAESIAPVYCWPASTLLAVLLWYEVRPIGVAVAWAYFAVVLFELGRLFRKDYLRQQAYVLFVISFIRLVFVNLTAAGTATHVFNSRVSTVLPLIGAYFWVFERMHREATASKLDRFVCPLTGWLGTFAIGMLLYFEIRPEWFILSLACMAGGLLLTGWMLKRTIFLEQALVAIILVVQQALFFFFMDGPFINGHWFYTSRVFTVGLASAILLLALPIAFAVRRQYAVLPKDKPAWTLFTLYRPEQPFFFAPLLLITLLLAVELRAGMITIGWSGLGVVVFLFALMVGERSYRLAGLGLLMLGVTKIILIDIWHASPSDRYITLIVMGAALLLVSFLYSRYRETVLKFL